MPLSSSDRTLVIMAKAPRPGMVKTRLAQGLPPDAVISLYRALLEDTLALAQSVPDVQVAVMCPDSDKDALTELFAKTVPIVQQKGEGLAAGLTSVFRHFTGEGKRVIAFNSDSPHLPSWVLDHAFAVLTPHDLVIGPTPDGGYYLVGAKASYPSLFDGDGMGTVTALERLLARTKALELSAGFTEPFYDIDVPRDLIRLESELRTAPQKAPRTAAWFGEWNEAVARLRRAAGVP